MTKKYIFNTVFDDRFFSSLKERSVNEVMDTFPSAQVILYTILNYFKFWTIGHKPDLVLNIEYLRS